MEIKSKQKNEKLALMIGFFFLFVLLFGSIFFYKERMLFIDPAFIIFEIINKGNFVFSEMRYGAFITQAFPLIGCKLGLSLKALLILYSASFYIFFILVTYISGFLLKQYKLAILFCLYLILFVSDVYFWPNNEIHQAIGWLILFLSVYRWSETTQKQNKVGVHLILLLCLFFATISHLLVMLPLCFLWAYDIIKTVKTNNKISLQTKIYSVFIVGFIGLRYWLSHSSWYDGAKLNGVKSVNLDKLLQTFTNDQALSIYELLFTKYPILLFLFLIGHILLLRRKKYIQFGITIVSILVYFILVTLTHDVSINSQNLFYFESQWMAWTLLICTPFVFEVFDYLENTKLITILFFFIFFMKLPQLSYSLNKFQQRINLLELLIDQAQKENKFKAFIHDNNENLNDDLMMNWGLPIETLLLTTVNNETPTTIKVIIAKSKVCSAQDSIYTAFKLIHKSQLNEDYFVLDSLSYYQRLNIHSQNK